MTIDHFKIVKNLERRLWSIDHIQTMKLYDFTVKDINGNEIPLDKYAGQVLLIVNSATKCGLTPQYSGLQDLYDKYQADGLEILDFPSNQFANQAPEDEDEIKKIREDKFNVTYPLFKKINVNGDTEDPLYTFLKTEKGGILGSAIKWNFTKFLVDREGQVIKRYAPTDTPEKIGPDIEKALAQS